MIFDFKINSLMNKLYQIFLTEKIVCDLYVYKYFFIVYNKLDYKM